MFSIDTKDIRKLEHELDTLSKKALPFATKATINKAAFLARGFAQDDIKSSMTLRNKFALQSIRVDQAKGLKIPKQFAILGSTADFMETQEFGGTKASKGKHGVAIPTSYSAGQGRNRTPRTRLPRRPNKLANIRLRNKRKAGHSRAQRNLIAIKQAATSGQKFLYLDLGNSEGIFKVTGGQRNPRIQMVHDLSRRSVRIPRNPWLLPAVQRTGPLISSIYTGALRFQIQRLRLFQSKG